MTQKFIRRDSELPVDAPLSATDGFIWSRLEAPQTVDDLTRATGLGLEQVHASLKTLLAAGLVGHPEPLASEHQTMSPSHSTPPGKAATNQRPVQLSRLIEMGHLALDRLPATILWPELTDSRQTAFENFRVISDTWLSRFKGLRGPERIRGEKLLSRLRRLRDSAPHPPSKGASPQCAWLMEPGRFLRVVEQVLPEEVSIHPGVAAVASNPTPQIEGVSTPPVAKASVGNKKASMNERRAQIEARRRESLRSQSASPPPPQPQGESSGAHRVAGLDAHALYQKAVNAFSQGLVEESARAIQLALAIAPDDPKLQALDAEVSSEWKRQRAHKLAKQATNDWSVGLIEPAVNKIVEAADLVPDYASIAAQAADYCLLTGRLELAVEFADRAVVNAPSRLDYRLAAAAAFFAAGDELVAQEQLSIIKEHIRELESRPDD